MVCTVLLALVSAVVLLRVTFSQKLNLPRKRGRPMDFCCRSAAQSDQVGSKLRGSNWCSESNVQSAKLPCHILSNGQDELRILVEKAEYEAKSCFFTFDSLKSRDFS